MTQLKRGNLGADDQKIIHAIMRNGPVPESELLARWPEIKELDAPIMDVAEIIVQLTRHGLTLSGAIGVVHICV